MLNESCFNKLAVNESRGVLKESCLEDLVLNENVALP